MDLKAKILVVEDDRVVAEDIRRTLEQMGYTVSAISASGEDAIKNVEKTEPDLILMDIVIRGSMTGIETAEEIRKKHDIPVVYLTAYADEKTLEDAKSTSPFGYILKPFNGREIQTAIEMAIYKYRTDKKLRENEAWLSTTLRSIGDGVIATDTERKIRFINRTALDLLGYENEEVVGKDISKIFKIIDKNSGLPVTNLTSLTIKQGKTSFLRNGSIILKREGSTVPVDGNSSPIFDERGKVIGAVKVFRDISDRLQAEKIIRNSEEKYRTLFETIAQGVLYYDHEGKITSGNPAAENILGVNIKPMYGKSLFDTGLIIVKEDGTKYSETEYPVKISIKKRHCLLNNVIGIVKENTIFKWLLVDITPQYDSSSTNLISVVMSFTDITKRRRVELALHHRNEQLRSLVHLAHEISTTLDINEILNKALNVLIESTVFSSGSILLLNNERNSIDIEVHKDTPMRIQNTIRDLFLDKSSFYRRSVLNGNTKIYPLKQIISKDFKDGVITEASKSANYCIVMPINIDSNVEGSINLIGKIKEVSDHMLDDFLSSIGLHLGLSLKNAKLFNEIKITLKQLKDTQNKLIRSEKLAVLGALTSNIVHEIGNPLAAIDNSIQVLERKIKLEGKLKELMNIILWETKRLIRIIDELREFSKPKRFNFVQIDMRDIIKKAVYVVNQDVELIFDKEVRYRPPKEQFNVFVDPDAIEQVVINLIRNGLQAVKQAGIVKVSLHKNCESKSPCVVLRIKDNGEGIYEKDFDKIFEPYFSTKAKGMGLGMHIVKTNVEIHGGTIKLESKREEGTVVTVEIPVKRGENGKNTDS